MQGKPSLRDPQPCGRNDYPSSGREPGQMGWYHWVYLQSPPDTSVLDVGAGMGVGLAYLCYLGIDSSRGFEADARLKHLPGIDIGESPLALYGEKSWDVITCFDVIEHVLEDLDLFNELIKVARERVYISTPNFSRSQAANHHHCREYTISEFVNIFQPKELWVASPDGWYNRTLLLHKVSPGWPSLPPQPGDTKLYRCPATQEQWKVGEVPLDHIWNEGSPDKQEWAHYCGVFYQSKH